MKTNWNEPPSSSNQLLEWRLYTCLWKANCLEDPAYWVGRWVEKNNWPQLDGENWKYMFLAIEDYMYPGRRNVARA